MTVETCNMTANVVNMNPPAKSNPSPSAAKLRVERWSQLGIGLDGNGVLAFIQAPEFGAAVRKKDGVPLDLTGRRWAVVLDLASRSTDGRTILRRELLQRLGKDAGPSRPTASASSAAAEGLTESSPKTATYLASLFSELRGDLDKCIAGPGDGSAARFRESVGEIDLGFVVRPLLEDDSRHCTFGAPSL